VGARAPADVRRNRAGEGARPLADRCASRLALGTGTGYWAHGRDNPLILGVLPHGFYTGLKKEF
jgi:hypothetical protein